MCPAGQTECSEMGLDHLRGEVGRVSAIRLWGAPRTLIVGEWALHSPEGDVSAGVLGKIQVLARDEGMRVVVLSAHADALDADLSGIPHLEIVPSPEGLEIEGPAMGIVEKPYSLPPNVCAWYVGSGAPPPAFHASRRLSGAGANEILSLYGTALVQERAGIAFRAAGAGRRIPSEADFDPAILDGIARAVALPAHRVAHGRDAPIDLERETDRIITAALPAILASQDPGGAVAAAPPPKGPNDPNYWFFWQRDAGQVVIALSHLGRRSTEPATRRAAQDFVARYLDFVERLPHGAGIADLGVSRFEMDGRPIQSYGNPQKDGPAQTVLAVTAALGDGKRAHRITAPYLDYLDRFISGPSFDPWEFAVGTIFYDDNLARRALQAGARLAQGQGDRTASERYAGAVERLDQSLSTVAGAGYTRAGHDYLQPFLNTISNLDIAVPGSVLTAYDVKDPTLNVEHPLIAGTMHALERVYADRWPVNAAWQAAGNAGMGMGRFPEDANDGMGSTGGNPWTFATLWAAQYYLRLIERHRFLQSPDPKGDREWELLERADGYLQFVLAHLSPASLTEQIDGETGKPRGAPKLAWAQASLIDTLLLRRELTAALRRY
jgi:hypothetical protein